MARRSAVCTTFSVGSILISSLMFLACGVVEVLPAQICVDVGAAQTARGVSTCTETKCMVKRTKQQFTAALCAKDQASAAAMAQDDRAWRQVAVNAIKQACRGFSCPEPNPCTIDGRTCNVQPARARFVGRTAPTCTDTGKSGSCGEGETTWHCKRQADVEGGKVCGCLDAGQRAEMSKLEKADSQE